MERGWKYARLVIMANHKSEGPTLDGPEGAMRPILATRVASDEAESINTLEGLDAQHAE